MEDMDPSLKKAKGTHFRKFARWLSRYQTIKRREARRRVKETFERYDRDKSGILDRDEFKVVFEKTKKELNLSSLPFEEAWLGVRKVPHGEQNEDGVFEEGVSFKSFGESTYRSECCHHSVAAWLNGACLPGRELVERKAWYSRARHSGDARIYGSEDQ
eukprot:SAG31_NODE_3852_length_3817_cov_6.007800_6_plen_159_part_00